MNSPEKNKHPPPQQSGIFKKLVDTRKHIVHILVYLLFKLSLTLLVATTLRWKIFLWYEYR